MNTKTGGFGDYHPFPVPCSMYLLIWLESQKISFPVMAWHFISSPTNQQCETYWMEVKDPMAVVQLLVCVCTSIICLDTNTVATCKV